MLKYEALKSYKVVVFDLDNTLYNETDYLFAAYKSIGYYLEKETGKSFSLYTSFLIKKFQEEGRNKLFDKLLLYFTLEKHISYEALFEILRTCNCPLKVHRDIKILLRDLLKNGHSIYILTNGNIVQQKNKIAHLDILNMLKYIHVIYANEFIPKPSPFCLNQIIINEKISKKNVVLIGDSNIDEQTALAAGVNFININNCDI